MPEAAISVGVVVEKRFSSSPWIDHTWVPVAVFPGLPDAPPMSLVAEDASMKRYYLGAINLVVASVETANYRDNLTSGMPKIWVVLRDEPHEQSVSLLTVTVDPAEGEAHTEAASNIVDCVPMVPDIAVFLAAFVEEHHVEREFYKRKRDRSDGGPREKRQHGDDE